VAPIIYELDKPFLGSKFIYAENLIEMNEKDKLNLTSFEKTSKIKLLMGF
jgi:hypothetical protein